MICQVCDTKLTTWCSSSISHNVICIPETARYVIPKQLHDVFHAETERPRVKKSRRQYISWMEVVGMIDHVWYALKMIPGTTRYVIRNQPHDVHDRSHIMRYVYHELSGMWYEIKQKQQKMPKARANINVYSSARFSGSILKTKWYVYHELPGMWYELKHKLQKMLKARANIYVYSSTRFSGLIFEDEKTVPYDDDTRNYMVCDTKSACQVCDTKSTTWCSWSISHDVICIPRTARYVVRNQAEKAEDAESTSEHQRIQQYAIFRFNFWRRRDMYATNCQVCYTN